MTTKIYHIALPIFSLLMLFTACKKHEYPPLCGGANDSTITTKTVFASGLNNPRGLKFGPDGNLYVAEGGLGGTNLSTTCTQVLPPVGPYTGSNWGSRISKIDKQGNRTTYVDSLPSSMTAVTVGSSVSGVSDVAFNGVTMYALLAGAGCSHGVPDIPNGIIKINQNKSWTMLANLSEFIMNNPVQNPEEDDFEPDGDWYSMINVGNDFYAIEPNHGELDKITSSGKVSRVIDFSATLGHIVPTSVIYHDGYFYVGNLNVFPIVPGSSSVYQVSMDGQIREFATGFNTIVGLAFDNKDRLYILQMTEGAADLTPGLGNIMRLDAFGKREMIVNGLDLPTAMTFGADGNLYVSNWGIGAPGAGEILQIGFKCEVVQGYTAKQ